MTGTTCCQDGFGKTPDTVISIRVNSSRVVANFSVFPHNSQPGCDRVLRVYAETIFRCSGASSPPLITRRLSLSVASCSHYLLRAGCWRCSLFLFFDVSGNICLENGVTMPSLVFRQCSCHALNSSWTRFISWCLNSTSSAVTQMHFAGCCSAARVHRSVQRKRRGGRRRRS
jgi:hypothetical protein